MNIEQKTVKAELRPGTKDTLAIRFEIRGNARFLSHLETIRVFKRALVRAGVKVCYSEGFNPHPKLSLPFPRSVGLESDDELACVLVPTASAVDSARDRAEQIKNSLGKELPDGCELISVRIVRGRVSFFHPILR